MKIMVRYVGNPNKAFNDANEEKAIHQREHLIMLEVTGVFGVTLNGFNVDQRKWNGSSSIMIKKGKKKMTFSGLDLGQQRTSEAVVNHDNIFKGTQCLPAVRPGMNLKLYPIDKQNRTILG